MEDAVAVTDINVRTTLQVLTEINETEPDSGIVQ